MKNNHGNLCDDVKTFFDSEPENTSINRYETTEKDHGRFEKREYGLYSKIDWLILRNPQWSMIKSIGFVRSTRIIKNKKAVETRYYIVSYQTDVRRFESDVCNHWGVENLAILRRLAINRLEMDTIPKRSKHRKKNLAGSDNNYLKSLLFS